MNKYFCQSSSLELSVFKMICGLNFTAHASYGPILDACDIIFNRHRFLDTWYCHFEMIILINCHIIRMINWLKVITFGQDLWLTTLKY